MANAAKKPTTPIQQTIRRFRELYREMNDLYVVGGDDATETAEYRALADEATRLESLIVATPAQTRNDVAAKRRYIHRMDFLDQDEGFLGSLVETILRLDAERIAAAG